MDEKIIDFDEKITPAFVIDADSGQRFELDFSRDSIRFAEQHGFKIQEVTDFPLTGAYDLFFYSFRKNHRNIPREKTDKLLEHWDTMPEKLLKRLILLYQQALLSSGIGLGEDSEKNAKVILDF